MLTDWSSRRLSSTFSFTGGLNYAGDVYSVLSYRDKLLTLEKLKLAADAVPHVLVPAASVRDGVLVEAHDAFETIGVEALKVATFTFAQVRLEPFVLVIGLGEAVSTIYFRLVNISGAATSEGCEEDPLSCRG
jgi:hypothetical protein